MATVVIARAAAIRRLLRASLVGAVFVFCPPLLAHAQGADGLGEEWERPSPRRRFGWGFMPEMQLAVRGQLGLGTPLGAIGAEVEFSPVGRAALAVGIGAGWGGTQLAGTARVRVVQGGNRVLHALVVGLGASYGHYRRYVLEETWYWPFDAGGLLDVVGVGSAAWLNVECAYELRTAGGFSLRTFVGWAFLLNPSALRRPDPLPPGCDSPEDCPVGRGVDVFPFVGVALGFWVG